MFRRRNYFIKKGFQLNFTVKFILLLLLEAGLMAAFFMHISGDTLTTGYMDSVLRIERTPEFFFVPFLFVMLIVGVGIALAAMIVFILLSHRIAGPLYRFEKDLEEISSGNLVKRVNLRRTDELNQLKESINMVVDSFDARLGRAKTLVAQLRDILSDGDYSKNASEIKRLCDILKKEIDHFKVTSGPNE